MLKTYAHTQTLTPEISRIVDESALWKGLLCFVQKPERFNNQITKSTVRIAAGDVKDTVYDRTLDFGSHRVHETVFLNPEKHTAEFHVQATKDYPASVLRMEVGRFEKQLPGIAFAYFAESQSPMPESMRTLINQAREQKDKDILEQIILDCLELAE